MAERHTYQSKLDAGLDISKGNFLKNIFFNNYLQLISVTIQKSFVENLTNAIKTIKAYNIDCVPHTSNHCPAHRRNKLTVARMHAFLGTAERFGASDLSQFVWDLWVLVKIFCFLIIIIYAREQYPYTCQQKIPGRAFWWYILNYWYLLF